MKNCDLHNSSFNRVWLKTVITVKFALKNCIDSICQTSKNNFLDPFRAYFKFFEENHNIFSLFGPPKQSFQQHVTLKLHFLQEG